MKKIVFKLDYEEEKLKAIKVSLKEKGRDIESELGIFLDGLYKKNVPKVLKKYIESGLENESEEEEKNGESNIKQFGNENNSLANNTQNY